MTRADPTTGLGRRFRLIGTWNTLKTILSCSNQLPTITLTLDVLWLSFIWLRVAIWALQKTIWSMTVFWNVLKRLNKQHWKRPKRRLRRRLKSLKTRRSVFSLHVLLFFRRQSIRGWKRLYRKQSTISSRSCILCWRLCSCFGGPHRWHTQLRRHIKSLKTRRSVFSLHVLLFFRRQSIRGWKRLYRKQSTISSRSCILCWRLCSCFGGPHRWHTQLRRHIDMLHRVLKQFSIS